MNKFIPLIAFAISLAACNNESKQQETQEQAEHQRYDLALKDKLDVFGKLPQLADNPANPSTAEKISLGHHLYFDTRLSKDGKNSCNSCHNLATFGVDNLQFSPGDKGLNGDRNSPTVLNAALHAMQFWDGRAKDVEEQAGMPILNPVEMAIPSEKFLVDRLASTKLYQELFAKAYPEELNPVNYSNLRKAIAAFERQLITPSRFDQYLSGDLTALSLEEKKGLSTFINVGCTSCHSGELLGGKMIQKFGVFADYWTKTNSGHKDEGLFKITGLETDKFLFKTPSLRNIEKTFPYFHDGSVKELEEAVRIMAEVQLDKKLTDMEVKNITAFLKSLTGDIPEQFKTAPVGLQ
jgi:cytochrome c peroxidase